MGRDNWLTSAEKTAKKNYRPGLDFYLCHARDGEPTYCLDVPSLFIEGSLRPFSLRKRFISLGRNGPRDDEKLHASHRRAMPFHWLPDVVEFAETTPWTSEDVRVYRPAETLHLERYDQEGESERTKFIFKCPATEEGPCDSNLAVSVAGKDAARHFSSFYEKLPLSFTNLDLKSNTATYTFATLSTAMPDMIARAEEILLEG